MSGISRSPGCRQKPSVVGREGRDTSQRGRYLSWCSEEGDINVQGKCIRQYTLGYATVTNISHTSELCKPSWISCLCKIHPGSGNYPQQLSFPWHVHNQRERPELEAESWAFGFLHLLEDLASRTKWREWRWGAIHWEVGCSPWDLEGADGGGTTGTWTQDHLAPCCSLSGAPSHRERSALLIPKSEMPWGGVLRVLIEIFTLNILPNEWWSLIKT